MINTFRFGAIVINNIEYTSDCLIFPDGEVKDSWWRKTGHMVTETDIIPILDVSPEIIIFGTGIHGMMKPSKNLINPLNPPGLYILFEFSQDQD